MARQKRNGVDSAIAVLLALAESDGSASPTALARRTAIPRSTLHRIMRILAGAGVVDQARGQIWPGPSCTAFLPAETGSAGRSDRLTDTILHRLGRSSLWRPAASAPTTPLELSPPASPRRKAHCQIGFSNAAMDNPWRVALVHGIEYAAAHLSGHIARLSVLHADNDPDRQAEDIDRLVREGTDGLLVSAVASPIVYEAVDRAAGAGVAVVLVDRGVPPTTRYCSFVTSDDAFIGYVTALWLAETLGGAGTILLLPGLEGAGPALQRLDAAREVFASFPDIRVRATEWTGWKQTRAYQIVADLLAGPEPAIDGIWCDSGLQSIGSLRAFIDAGYGPGTIPPHTGGDLNGAYKLALRNKVRLAAVDFPPAMGVVALDVLLSSLEGLWVPRTVMVPSDIIVTRGAATPSVRPSVTAEDHVHWDLPDDLILSAGLGTAYNPEAFRVHYPGNVYNRSAARMTA